MPQAIEGTIAVGLIYHLVRRRFSLESALLASLVLAITPTSVAVDRSNSPDSCLVLVLMLAGWALIVAAERSSWRILLLSAVLVGVAFNIKMLVAYGVLPIFILVYLLGTRLRVGVKLKHLAAAFLVVIVVSASWGLVVDLTVKPPPLRAELTDNSVLGSILGHNGLERLLAPHLGHRDGQSRVRREEARISGPPVHFGWRIPSWPDRSPGCSRWPRSARS